MPAWLTDNWIVPLFTGVIALATVAYVVFTILLWRATKKSADAALLNAKALINTERPWLEVVSTIDPDKGGMAGPRFVECCNQGKTPARIVGASAQHSFVNLPDALSEKYSSPIIMPERILIAKGDKFHFFPVGIQPDFIIQSKGKKALVEERKQFLMIYGNVVYRDMLYPDNVAEGLHETRWCFAYDPGTRLFFRTGPNSYNSYS